MSQGRKRVDSATIRKYTRIFIALAAVGVVVGVVGVIVGQTVLLKWALGLTAVAVTVSCVSFALGIHRIPPSDRG